MIDPWFASHPTEAFKFYIASLVLIVSSVLIGTITHTMSFVVASIMLVSLIPCLVLCVTGSMLERWLFERMTRDCVRLEDAKQRITLGNRGVNGIAFYRFTPGIQEWCSANLVGRYGILPQDEFKDDRIIWFSNPHDAMHFKLRWM